MIRLEGGARTGAIVAAGAAALGLGLLLPPGWAAAPVALYAAVLAFAAGRTAGRAEAAARRAAAALESQSARLGPALQGLLERLLRLEERLPDGPDAPADPALAEVGRELGELSELVRDLAVTLAAQGRELVALREAEPARAEPPPAAPAPKPAPPPARDPRPAEDAVADAVRADAVELHLQPIVGLPQRKVRLYDAQPRLRIGDATLAAAEFGPVVERLGIAAALDRKTLARAAPAARHLAARGSDALVALSLSPVAGLGPGGLRALAEIADPTAAERLVLFLSQGCWRGLDPEAAGSRAKRTPRSARRGGSRRRSAARSSPSPKPRSRR
ncbi:MAG TPA: EAL domain-containing protein, partial [Beijerinckiaceae bacterium]|nr:EAL domain-containing protein [Beijerinckiaceae bacterium]